MTEMLPADFLNVALSLAVGAVVVAVWIGVLEFKRQAAHNEAWSTVNILVNAAEQMLSQHTGPAKLEWVMTQLKELFPRLDTNLIRSMVEAAVGQMKQSAR